MGRRRTVGDSVGVRLTPDLDQRVHAYAGLTRVTPSSAIRALLRFGLETVGRGVQAPMDIYDTPLDRLIEMEGQMALLRAELHALRATSEGQSQALVGLVSLLSEGFAAVDKAVQGVVNLARDREDFLGQPAEGPGEPLSPVEVAAWDSYLGGREYYPGTGWGDDE